MDELMQYHKHCLTYVVTYVHIITSAIHDIGHEKSLSCSTVNNCIILQYLNNPKFFCLHAGLCVVGNAYLVEGIH